MSRIRPSSRAGSTLFCPATEQWSGHTWGQGFSQLTLEKTWASRGVIISTLPFSCPLCTPALYQDILCILSSSQHTFPVLRKLTLSHF